MDEENNSLKKKLFGNLSNKIIIVFLITAFLLTFFALTAFYFNSEQILINEVTSHLETTAQNKVNWIETYFNEREKNIETLKQTFEIEEALNQNFITEVDLAKEKIKLKAEIVSKQIQEYIEEHPKKTVKDLQEDANFQKIAVQPVGKTGYTAVTDSNSLICRFHTKKQIVNLDLSSLATALPGFWKIMSKTRGGNISEGFYEWKEPDGSVRKKYMYIDVVKAKTADNVVLTVAATTYIDEFQGTLKLLKKTETFLEHLKENQGYKRIYLINSKGKILWGMDKNSCLKNNDLESIENKDFPLTKIYFKVKFSDKTIFSDYYLCPKNNEPKLFVASPVKDSNKIIGFLILEINIKKINEILEERTGLGETGETFLVGKDYLMRSQSRFIKENTILKQKVITKHAKECLSYEFKGIEHEKKVKASLSKDYRGEPVLSAHVALPKFNWCLLAKIDEKEAIGTPRQALIMFALMLAVIIVLISAIISFFIVKNISNPIKKLYYATKRIEKGDFSVRLNIKTGDELEELGKTLNKAIASLEKMDAEHKQLDHAKTEFLSITSHELRSPMTPMKAQLQMLLEEYYGKVNEKQKKAIQIVLRNTVRLDRIIQDFLEISRIEAARLKFNFVKTNLATHIKQLIEEMNAFLMEKNIKIVSNIEELPEIECDPDRIMQVLRNLINNAKKFSPENSKIFVEAKVKNNMILISVKDNGIGISKEDQLKVFEPFYQAEKTMYRKYGGTGLGLAICKGIVESQNGKIWVESVKGKGSTFYFTVPFTPVKELKPIKLLFSPQEKNEARIEKIFVEILGPIGKIEFEELKKENKIIKEEINKYIDLIKEKGIIDDLKVKEFKSRINNVLNENK